MKKVYLLIACISLTSCDSNKFDAKFIGKCIPNEITTATTQQNGKKISIKTTTTFLCGCFNKLSPDKPFIIAQQHFLHNSEHTETYEQLIENTEYTITTENTSTDTELSYVQTPPDCDQECTNLCDGFTVDYVLGNW